MTGVVAGAKEWREMRRRTDEAALGDFGPGRYAWLLSEARVFRRPLSTRGFLGLWRWTAPVNFRDLEPEVAALLETM